MARVAYIQSVVPANAGTHNHRRELLRESRRPSRQDNIRRGAGTMEIVAIQNMDPHSRGALRPRFASGFALLSNRGRREDRVRAAPAVSCAMCTRKCAHEHTGPAGASRPSLRNGFTAYNVISPVNGSFATVAPKKLASQELDASTAASGPHDFAVRIRRVRLARLSRPSHLTARS